MRWSPYARLNAGRNDELRYLAIVVDDRHAATGGPEHPRAPAPELLADKSADRPAVEPPPRIPSAERANVLPLPEGVRWSRLSRQEVRDHGLSLMQSELARLSFSVQAETGQRRNVLHAKRGRRQLEVHMRTVRDLNYAFWPKARFQPRVDLYAGLVRLPEGAPAELYLIPSMAWNSPDAPLVAPEYEGLASEPEYGVRLTQRNLPLLAQFTFDRTLGALTD